MTRDVLFQQKTVIIIYLIIWNGRSIERIVPF